MLSLLFSVRKCFTFTGCLLLLTGSQNLSQNENSNVSNQSPVQTKRRRIENTYSYKNARGKGIFESIDSTYKSNPRNPIVQNNSQKKAALTDYDLAKRKIRKRAAKNLC